MGKEEEEEKSVTGVRRLVMKWRASKIVVVCVVLVWIFLQLFVSSFAIQGKASYVRKEREKIYVRAKRTRNLILHW